MRFLRDNGLIITLLALSILTISGMLLTGWGVHNEELAEHGARQLDFWRYAISGHFLSALSPPVTTSVSTPSCRRSVASLPSTQGE